MSFSTIALRANGQKIVQDWFNSLRAAGILVETYIGAGMIDETTFTIANNQSSAATITGLLFSGASVRSAFIDYQVYRNTTGGGALERSEAGMLIATYSTVAASWEITSGLTVGDSGVTFSITSGGQVKYVSDSQSGTPATSKMTFKARTMAV
jgi:hypothetical protein